MFAGKSSHFHVHVVLHLQKSELFHSLLQWRFQKKRFLISQQGFVEGIILVRKKKVCIKY